MIREDIDVIEMKRSSTMENERDFLALNEFIRMNKMISANNNKEIIFPVFDSYPGNSRFWFLYLK